MRIPARIALGAASGIIAAPVIAEAVTAQLRKRTRAEIVERRNASTKRVLVAFPAFANSSVSIEEMLPFFGSTNVFLVDYSPSGHDSKGLFADIVDRLDGYEDAELVLFGVSFGAGVALSFRRYLLSNAPGRFRSVRFIMYSPVITGEDLRPRNLAMAALGFILLGGTISKTLWRLTGGSRWLHGSAPPFEIEITQERLAEIYSSIDSLTVSLLSSQARTILRGHRAPRAREFDDDTAIIFAFHHDPMIVSDAPQRLATAFGSSKIINLPTSGHADVYRLRTLGEIMRPEILRFVQA